MYISFARPIVYLSLVYSSPIKPIASAVRRLYQHWYIVQTG